MPLSYFNRLLDLQGCAFISFLVSALLRNPERVEVDWRFVSEVRFIIRVRVNGKLGLQKCFLQDLLGLAL